MIDGVNKRIVILGAGPTGLGAAYQCWKQGCNSWTVYEREPRVGGLSSSVKDAAGFTWDIGGHVLFSHYRYFDDAVNSAMKGEYYEHLRESWIRILGCWVPYPFQNNIRRLPDAAMQECLAGLGERRADPQDAQDFRAWMEAVFGSGIVRYFMKPYNDKVWAVPLESMSRTWITERVSVVDRERIERNIAIGRDDVGWGPNTMFRFPRLGGTGAIFEGIARPFRDRVLTGRSAERIDLACKRIYFTDGNEASYDVLVNTTPLDVFIRSCVDVPEGVRRVAGDLVHTGGLMVGLGFRGNRRDPKCWMYFPEDNAPFYRVTNFHNYSPYNVPDGAVNRHFSLMAETSYSSYKKVAKERIVEDTMQGLLNTELLREADRSNVLSRHVIDVPYSYPVPTRGRDDALGVIQSYLEALDVYSRGRFGAWKYEVGNMDHSFMQGVEVVDRILFKKEEVTINGKL